MKEKTQYKALMEELQKIVENFRVGVAEIGEKFSKLLPDIEITEGEEDTWEMKCPYECGDTHYCIQPNGAVFADCWEGMESDNRYFSQGNVFPTEEAAELEAERRNLLTRFRAFRDECNGNWKPDFTICDNKYFIEKRSGKIVANYLCNVNAFMLFGYFKKYEDAKRAIKLFGDEIKELFVDCEG
nr:MAG TPA: hypothetical protein [Caudoviricetes sp.]